MQQRRLRLGDIVDDYCPRERRITNHAIVAMVEDEVKHTRCTTCDSDHEYKQAKVPPQRRKKDTPGTLVPELSAGVPRKRIAVPDDPIVTAPIELPDASEPIDEPAPEMPMATVAAEPAASAPFETPETDQHPDPIEDDGPVHRPLIRATLPRPEGQVPERKLPEFTAHQREVNGNRHGRGRRARHGQMRGQQGNAMGQTRFGQRSGGQAPRQGSGQGQRHGSGQAPRHGSGQTPRQGSGQGHGSGQPPRHGSGQGQRQGAPHGQRQRGRKRGR
jgi:hypothetical protein